ncbi:anion transporter [Geoalkalibacter halelectricus]|uniref:Anion transporter n=1 Tax=Geoalkalibacter halelectricus TaxID=2847045 RepID=A0ABY5ZP14_9BACT|nr:anion transporter [Geoalkalibacter halelectricus]MDO3377342.1 anion transporter [Geoalkalibacter halelectricus]UWZ80892.1 anion transporter [Geoalkalibacter halelectricus]
MDLTILSVFLLVYLGMVLGRLPGLALDRTGVALLGALALIALERLSPEQAWEAVDVSTIALLFGLMVVSAQLRLGGFYTWVTRRLAEVAVSPPALLGLLIGACGLLAAILANDIVCLAMAPMLAEGCARRGLDPKPYLLALACAANVGSAATLIGNPQNMLIGQSLQLSFTGYLREGGVPALLGLLLVWLVIAYLFRSRWHATTHIPEIPAPAFNRWQTFKGLAVTLLLMLAFVATDWPREIVALGAAGLLLMSRRMKSQQILALIDWQLLVLFIGLFVVNHALSESGMLGAGLAALRQGGIDLADPAWLFTATAVFSNLVSNVPAVMLLLPVADHALAGPILALSSTLAGNLFIVGSIANIIVVDQAARVGIHISWREHARVGAPVTLATLALAAAWLWLVA